MSTTDTEAAGDWKGAANYLAKRAEAPATTQAIEPGPHPDDPAYHTDAAPKLAAALADLREKMTIDKLEAMVRAINPPISLDAREPIETLAPYGRPAYELEAEQIAARGKAADNAPRSYPTTEPDTAPTLPRTLWSGLDRVHNYSDEMDTALDRVRKQIEQFKVLKELLHQELDENP